MKVGSLILLLSILCCISEACYDCRHHLNRKSSVDCAQSPSECGPCISGFVEDENLRVAACYSVEVKVHPPSKILADRYTNIELPCKFSGKLNCGWTHDGYQVDIHDSHKFRIKKTTETTDCTLTINNVNKTDAGVWQCIGMSDSNSELSIKSNESTLKYYDLWDGLIAVDEGYDTLLICFSEQPVDCEWWAKKPDFNVYDTVTIDDDKVQYVEKTEGPKRDCSIRVKYRYMEELNLFQGYSWVCWAHDKVKDVWKAHGNEHAVYFNAMAIGWQIIPIQYYKALNNNGTFSCLNSTISIEFTLHKNVFRNLTLNANSNRVSLKDIENYNQNKWIKVTITCGNLASTYWSAVITNDNAFPFVSNESPNSEKILKDVEKNNFLQIYFKNKLMDGQTISYEQLKSANDEMKCVTDMNPSEMKWSIDGIVLSNAIRVQSLNLTVDKIDAYYLKHSPTNATLQCVNVFSNGTFNGVSTNINFPAILTPTLIFNPVSINKNYGDAAGLACAFDVAVRCAWKKRKTNSTDDFEEVSISGDYEYLDVSPGTKSDCSIKIQQLSVKEEGEWICRGCYGVGQHVDSREAIVTGRDKIINGQQLFTLPKVDNTVPLKSKSPQIINNVYLLISLTLFSLLMTKIY